MLRRVKTHGQVLVVWLIYYSPSFELGDAVCSKSGSTISAWVRICLELPPGSLGLPVQQETLFACGSLFCLNVICAIPVAGAGKARQLNPARSETPAPYIALCPIAPVCSCAENHASPMCIGRLLVGCSIPIGLEKEPETNRMICDSKMNLMDNMDENNGLGSRRNRLSRQNKSAITRRLLRKR